MEGTPVVPVPGTPYACYGYYLPDKFIICNGLADEKVAMWKIVGGFRVGELRQAAVL